MTITKSIEKVKVRFATFNDLAFCEPFENLSDMKIVGRKIAVNEILVAELSGEVVGYLRLDYIWSKIPYISLIVVIETMRGRGIGRAMLSYLKDHLKKQGAKFLLSSSQVNEPQPQHWHRSSGFTECGILNGVNEFGVGEVFFRLDL